MAIDASPSGGLRAFIARVWSRSELRYLTVGVLLFVLGAAVTLTLAGPLGVDVRIAEGVSRAVGATVGFFGHKYVSFRDDERGQAVSFRGQGTSYAALAVINTLVAPWVLWGLVQLLGSELLVLAKLLSDAIMVCETYVLLKLVFRPGVSAEDASARAQDEANGG